MSAQETNTKQEELQENIPENSIENNELGISKSKLAFEGYKSIRIDEIHKAEKTNYQFRNGLDEEKIEAMVESFKAQNPENPSIKQPVLVTEEDGNYVLVDGHHRFEAAKRAGWIKIVASFCSPEEAIKLATTLNIVHNEYNCIEKYKAITAYMDNKKWDGDDKDEVTAKELGLSKSNLSNYRRLGKLTDEERDELIKFKNPPIMKLCKLAGMDNVNNADKRKQFFDEIVEAQKKKEKIDNQDKNKKPTSQNTPPDEQPATTTKNLCCIMLESFNTKLMQTKELLSKEGKLFKLLDEYKKNTSENKNKEEIKNAISLILANLDDIKKILKKYGNLTDSK